MIKYFICMFLLLSAATTVLAHFVFVVPDINGVTAKVILSENLTPDAEIKMIADTKLTVSGTDGVSTPLTLSSGEGNFYTTAIIGTGTRVIHGISNLGVMSHGNGRPNMLIYYPKTILGNAFDEKTQLRGKAPVELIPVGDENSFRFRLLTQNRPQADAQVTVLLPDGTEKKLTTDANGETESFSAKGRYGAWARYWQDIAGEHDGKKYEQVRNYATLTFTTDSSADTSSTASILTKLPEATSSFGATVADGWLYVYGGHTSPTHTYFKGATSGKFHRVRLSTNPQWEELPEDIAVQGTNLAAHYGKIFRIGGMEPRNERNQAADNHSLNDAAYYDVASQKWERLPSLPESRSSHDITVVNNKLYVIGGWALEGKKEFWRNTVEVLDLDQSQPQWTSISQPFQRRALMSASIDGKIYVIGGMNEKQKIAQNVSILDTTTRQWSEGPALPSSNPISGFAPAIGVHKGKVYASLADGQILRLNTGAQKWEKVTDVSPRVAHRLVSYQDSILLLGGAAKGKNLDLIEIVPDGE